MIEKVKKDLNNEKRGGRSIKVKHGNNEKRRQMMGKGQNIGIVSKRGRKWKKEKHLIMSEKGR